MQTLVLERVEKTFLARGLIRNPLNYERLGKAPHSSPYHGIRLFFPLAKCLGLNGTCGPDRLEKILKSTRFFGIRMTP
jgi:hypothetical protein